MLKENINHFAGPIIDNSLEDGTQGIQINIEQGVFVPNDPPGAYQIGNMAHYDGVILSVHFKGDTWSTVEGSAVMIAPGIALAAAHVIEPLKEEILQKGLRPFCVGLTPSGLRVWKVQHVTRAFDTDILVLSLEYASPVPPDGRFVQAVMTTRLPEIGEPIMVSGFRASPDHVPNADFPYFHIEQGQIKYGADLHVGVGVVTQRFLSGRGQALPGPILEVDCVTSGGMSGGPAFDKDGKVIGILSASMDYGDGAGHSLISLLAPALVARISHPAFLNVYQQFGADPLRLLDLPSELCGIEGREAIHEEVDPVTSIIRL